MESEVFPERTDHSTSADDALSDEQASLLCGKVFSFHCYEGGLHFVAFVIWRVTFLCSFQILH